MSVIEEIEPKALLLSEADRANLALRLLQSLPATLRDEDDGLREARNRDLELNEGNESGISLQELDGLVRRRRNE